MGEGARVAAFLAGAAVLASAPGSAAAQDAAFWDVPVVTPAGQASRVSESPSTTFVVTGDELRHAGAATLPEILRRIPGLDVRQMTAMDGQLGLRGFAYELADRILVLVDGRTVYVDFLGATFYEAIPISVVDIERIEVVLGPGASVYGSKAMLGTVNIITKSALDFPGVEARLDAGSAAEYRLGARAAAVTGPWRLRATGLARSLELFDRDVRGNAGGGTLQAAYSPNAGTDVSLEAGVMSGLTYLIPTARRIDGFEATLAHARLQAHQRLGGPGSPAGDLALDLVWNLTRVDAPTFPTTATPMWARGSTPYAELSHALRTRVGGAPLSLRWGAEARLQTVKSTITAREADIWNTAGFATGEAVLDRFRVTAGLRFDHSTLSGRSLSPRFSVVWTPADGHQVRAAYNTGFNDPNLLTRFADFSIGPGPAGHLIGDRHLAPERAAYGELAYAGSITGALHAFASAFTYRFDDWISLQPARATAAGVPYGNNAEGVDVVGGEAGLEVAPSQRISGYASYALLEAAHASDYPYCGVKPPGSPKHKVGAGVRVGMGQGGYFTADGQWVAASDIARLATPGQAPAGCTFAPEHIGAYLTVSARLGWAFGNGLDLSVAGSNLLDDGTRQFSGAERPERRVMATVAVSR
ncbi:MAG: TonB-dependent receptor [Anaeromyxobacter sp.]